MATNTGIVYNDSQTAFETAISEGRLSTDRTADNYAGHYMYMGQRKSDWLVMFKHLVTRKYLD